MGLSDQCLANLQAYACKKWQTVYLHDLLEKVKTWIVIDSLVRRAGFMFQLQLIYYKNNTGAQQCL